MCPLHCVPQAKDDLKVDYTQRLESPVTPSEQEAETIESQDTSKEEEEGGSDSSGLQVEETSVLTNGELSEEEEEEVLPKHKSILPSSVLDQASVIAERFISSLSRRSSLVSEDLGSIACPSPSVDNDTLQSPSAFMDLEKQTQMLISSLPEPPATTEAALSLPAQEPALNPLTGERRSTLSKQDRLLIHKIRRYYEHAEHQDADFCIKRRESLSYIPAGLVRHLSRQLNSIPQEKAVSVHRKISRNRPTSWSVFDLPGLEKSGNTETCHQIEMQKSAEANAGSQSITEEEFRPSSDMLKVWQDMEIEVESQEVQQVEGKVNGLNLEVRDVNSDTLDVASKQATYLLEEPKINTASNVSPISSPTATSPAEDRGPGHGYRLQRTTVSEESSNFSPSQLPKIISFRTSIDEDQILQEMGKMKNKVFQLARQYSQRIKNNRPMVWQRNRETATQEGFKNIAAVPEEKMQQRKGGN